MSSVSLSLFLYEMSLLYGNESIYLVACRYTLSIISISFTDWGAHTCELYERLLITRAVYNAFWVDWIFTYIVDLRMKPSILFALEASAGTWQFHFKSLHTKIPRYFWASLSWTGVFWSIYDNITGLTFLVIDLTVHLHWLRSILQSRHNYIKYF